MWITLAAMTISASMILVDQTAVPLATPHAVEDLGAQIDEGQWILTANILPLAALMVLGGRLGDLYGLRKVFLIGAVVFGVSTAFAGFAQDMPWMIAARAAQGAGAALMMPTGVAIVSSVFPDSHRGTALGVLAGGSAFFAALGPVLGGLLTAVDWRLVFLINVPLAVLVIAVAWRHVPESRDTQMPPKLDVAGVVLGALGLGGLTYGFTAWNARGPGDPVVYGTLLIGVACLVGFVLQERRSPHPMLPLSIFRSRAFAADNLVTFAVYAALGGVFFLLVLQLQVVAGFQPLAAGLALLPVTVIMLLLSARMGALAERIGPRIPMTVGPLIIAASLLWLSRIGPHASYLRDVLPPVVLEGLGLSLTVAPLTATALGSVEDRHAGVASGVNNAVARAAGLLAVAVLPLAAGLGTGRLTDPVALAPTFRNAMMISAGLLVVGAVISLIGIPTKITKHEPSPVRSHCAISGPPLHPERAGSR
jgi:EmrB/QacA subfamily drug resistance transporter